MKYNTIVGLEIHTQLLTKSKAFCSCKNEFGAEPNTICCPICLGLPGSLPSLNEESVRLAIMAGLAFNCKINNFSTMDRKKYFYPDLVKGYQCTQQYTPICQDGYIELDSGKKIGIARIHIEEDTGKSVFEDNTSLLDFNRCGASLVEIVTEPDISNGEEAREFLNKLRNTLYYIGVSDGKMEEGSMRCDVNINIEDIASKERSNIIEIKNMSSFSAVERAIDFEAKRQVDYVAEGEKEVRSTRKWDDNLNETVLMRLKLTEDDYRYTSDIDMPNIYVEDDYIEEIRRNMPELIEEKKERFIKEYGLNEYDASVITSNRELSDYFERLAEKITEYELLSNFVINDLLRRIEVDQFNIKELKYTEDDLKILLEYFIEDKINNSTLKKVFRLMFEEGIDPKTYIEENNLIQINDDKEIDILINEVLDENPESIDDYLGGRDRALGFLVGQVMKKSAGKANPQIVNKKIKAILDSKK